MAGSRACSRLRRVTLRRDVSAWPEATPRLPHAERGGYYTPALDAHLEAGINGRQALVLASGRSKPFKLPCGEIPIAWIFVLDGVLAQKSEQG